MNCFSIREFKYISCSYLSEHLHFPHLWQKDSNTSHVLIYQHPLPKENIKTQGFKYISCSYLSIWVFRILSSWLIQIHLMFLFIDVSLYHRFTDSHIQIHLMFLFINYWNGIQPHWKLIQIHLMFLFILSNVTVVSFIPDSNTSHVLIYLSIR